MKTYIYTFLLLIFPILLNAQTVENKSVLTISQIMQGEKFVGYAPSNINWSTDSKIIYFDWNPDMEILKDQFKVGVNNTNKIERVTISERIRVPSFRGNWNQSNTKKVYSKNGDLFLFDAEQNQNWQLTSTLNREYNPEFSATEEEIIYTSNNNLFAWSIENGGTAQLTDFRKGTKKPKKSKPEYQEWLHEDQLAHFQILREREIKSDLRKQFRDTLKPKRPLEIYHGDKSISNIKLSPNRDFVTFSLTKSAKADRTDVPNFITTSGYVENINARSKVGSPQDTYEFGIYDRSRDTFYIIDEKQIDGIYDKPAYLETYHTDTTVYNPKWEKPRSVIYHGVFYSRDGSKALMDIRAMDNKDRWLMSLDLKTGQLTLLDRQHDDAWIGGPGVGGWDYYPGNLGWINNQTFYYQSEKTGFSHLYLMNINTKKITPLTEGKFEILSAELSKDKQSFWITSNKETPHEHHFYQLPVRGGKMKKITNLFGGNEVTISPDENWLAIRHSTSNAPWELYLMKNEIGAKPIQITNSTTKEFKKYDWRKPEIIRFTASDGVKVPARIYKPKNPNGKAVIFVHGAGYLQNVHEWWSTYYREYMFHNILTDNGYTVLDIDYRASEGYGRDWRTAIYRHMGGKDITDNIDGAKYLAEEQGIDADKIGIYGGSYGGFVTLMSMFTYPKTFKSGAAIRSVTDWAHYNHPYTNNILNTPVLDSIAYHKSSPIYHAEGFEGNLLILHGMIDDNVQFQDVVRLSQRLIELGKDNWEFAVYPVERHGFVEPSSWADEYKRIFKLFQKM